MTSQQVLCVLPIPALLLLLSVHTFAEVVKSMSDCSHFFLNKTPPHIPGILEDGKILNQNRHKPICQTYKNQRRFLTLYDVQNKIPVFSAYKFVGDLPVKRPKANWMIEPQLEKETKGKNMIRASKNTTYERQAGDADYKINRTFDRGHIFPSMFALSKEDKTSTFTLTNIVPQAESFNKGSWNKMEQCTKCVMRKYCSGGREGFVVTGAQPSSNSKLNNRVNVPSLLWSAFCCYSAIAKKWIASAHWGDNVQDESEYKYLETKTLEELYQRLGTNNSEFVIFSGTKCPLQTTVTEFYPEMKNCHCPPTRRESLILNSGCSASTSSLTLFITLFIYCIYFSPSACQPLRAPSLQCHQKTSSTFSQWC